MRAAFALLLVLFVHSASEADGSEALSDAISPRPNIVLIVTDDQRWDTIDATHSPDGAPVMPAVFDRMVSEGVVFENGFVSTPVCAPSRAGLLSGQHAFRHGARVNYLAAERFDDSSTLATGRGVPYRLLREVPAQLRGPDLPAA